ncbi:hypothetical protein [Kutzneria kofuensis]|uniref:Hpr(Ser) kinase/phosphatase n=1 Tax=Kutzneria kofuensis TaxID=103725 RepID=A0A7W9KPR1_9PSEU|nr:hypothetical protein [Kutzneria kofuensis]MBB5896488.1 hypothetical protein [Kutzneria kofuensis]
MSSDIDPAALLAVPTAGITLAVVGNPSVVAALRQITSPFYQPVTAPRGEVWTLSLYIGDPGVEAADEPAHRAEFDMAARRITVRCAKAAWLPVFGTRYARTLVRALTIGRGAVPLHGAAVEFDGIGVILVGDKMAGKTTSALSLVRCGAALVSNDDVLLVKDAVDDWRLIGGPRSVGIRLGSLAEHRPALTVDEVAAATAGHPANRADKHFLHPGDIGRLGGVARVQAPGRVLIELVCEPGPTRSRRLDGDEAAAVLSVYLEDAADRRRFDLIGALGAPAPALTADTVGSLVRGLDFYRFSHPISGWVDDLLAFVKDIAAQRGGSDTAEVMA